MKMIILLVAAALFSSANGYTHRENRATRMSVVDFWKNETMGDGMNIRVAHGVNSWPALVDQLHEPFLNKSLLIEGDVFMQTHRRPRHRAIPVMSSERARVADRITFKDWMREVAHMGKAIKINLRSTEVVRPVLQYLYAAQADPDAPSLDSPLILHANVFRAPRSLEHPVDGNVLVEKTKALFPDATVSLGWTRQGNYSSLHDHHKKMSWRQVFHLLEYITQLDQPVMLSVRLSVAARSKEQLLWLLGLDKSISLLVWSDRDDEVDDWRPLLELRRMTTRNRVLYDLDSSHKQHLQTVSAESMENPPSFNLNDWRPVEFPSAGTGLSGIVRSEKGAAFIGRPSSLLLSRQPAKPFGRVQTVEGKVHFLPRKQHGDVDLDEDSGLSIQLLDRVSESEQKQKKAVEIFIGHDGEVRIENAMGRIPYYEKRAVGKVHKHDCYAFRIDDEGWRVSLDVWPERCGEAGAHRKRRDLGTTIQLDTPFQKNRNLRHVVVTKSGDASVDFLLERLQHSAASIRSLLLVLLVILLF